MIKFFPLRRSLHLHISPPSPCAHWTTLNQQKLPFHIERQINNKQITMLHYQITGPMSHLPITWLTTWQAINYQSYHKSYKNVASLPESPNCLHLNIFLRRCKYNVLIMSRWRDSIYFIFVCMRRCLAVVLGLGQSSLSVASSFSVRHRRRWLLLVLVVLVGSILRRSVLVPAVGRIASCER